MMHNQIIINFKKKPLFILYDALGSLKGACNE